MNENNMITVDINIEQSDAIVIDDGWKEMQLFPSFKCL